MNLMRTILTSLVLAGLLAGVGACVRHTEPLRSWEDMTPAERNFDNLWRASQYVLRKYCFTIDRQDRRAGLISTEPMTGKQLFEFWRHDTADRQDTYESTVQTIYRTVTVIISRRGAGDYIPRVVAAVGRSNLGRTRIVAVSDVYSMSFHAGERGGTIGEDITALDAAIKKAAETGKHIQPVLPEWLTPLGRDEKLEKKLLYEIVGTAMKHSYMEKPEPSPPKPLR